ncbi:mannosyl-3-phosphoglycerate phosphatase [Pseudooceanicola antarcticus]|uniref:Mannosyl-3-phosphoglycerate phosphatase n=1 Tax=Pseudooceanicola antarcticus TaxID=1247613 RepID=A0A285J159_9RHOB|nr:HAD-IIB family hydrolase [Pseudooceanicola antarcticus]PJE29906.1 mannosyl-3-phosphoglycerate phosphatase [Pseudooceanicola antarcticus]SNY53948.1 mannosyl-3-phosphoglycerate phosphatase [Pseudooceanicola antarcticus]
MTKPPFMVFSDLDGTLLDHESYSYAAALPALAQLRARNVPVVLASSKTGPEIYALREELRLSASPAIVENGAGLLMPREVPPEQGETYLRLRQALDKIDPELRRHFRGFGDLGPEGVSADAGLPPEKARMACQRAYSEPGLWDGDGEQKRLFLAQLSDLGIVGRRGGRYLTLSFGGTKADRMDEAAALYDHPPKIALGDAPNDREMLEHADIGVIIANPHGAPLPELRGERQGAILRSEKVGPAGWNEMMLKLASRLS